MRFQLPALPPYGRCVRAILRFSLVFACGLLFSQGLRASCSPQYKGLATINEVHQLSQSGANTRLVEVKFLTSMITRDDYQDWTLQGLQPLA